MCKQLTKVGFGRSDTDVPESTGTLSNGRICSGCATPCTTRLQSSPPIASVMPEVVDRVFGVPLKNRNYPSLMQGAYKTRKDGLVEEHALLYKGPIDQLPEGAEVLIRINSACFTGDIFHDESCDCNWQFEESLRMLEAHNGPGVVLYHFGHEGKAHGYLEKLRAYRDGMYPVDGDLRDFTSAIAILLDLRITRVRLMTNNPHKQAILEQNGISVVGVDGVVSADPNLAEFLDWKARHLGHHLPTIGK